MLAATLNKVQRTAHCLNRNAACQSGNQVDLGARAPNSSKDTVVVGSDSGVSTHVGESQRRRRQWCKQLNSGGRTSEWFGVHSIPESSGSGGPAPDLLTSRCSSSADVCMPSHVIPVGQRQRHEEGHDNGRAGSQPSARTNVRRLSGRRCTVRNLLGNHTPQTDPYKKALDSNSSTKKTAGNWISHQSLESELNQDGPRWHV